MISPMLLLPLLLVVDDGGKTNDFVSHIEPVFEELVAAHSALAPSGLNHMRRQAAESEIMRRREQSKRDFREAVGTHWPYDDNRRTKELLAYQAALKDIPMIYSQAAKGPIPFLSRGQAIERLRHISATYPHSSADHRAKRFLITAYRQAVPAQPDLAEQVRQALINDDAFHSIEQLVARKQDAQFRDRQSENLEASRALLSTLKQWENSSVLLAPAAFESHEDYIQRIFTTLDAIHTTRSQILERLERRSYQ
ncbi:hypothetical protein AB1K70_16115 [Bremerella sp. JC770]|uniref:hypothetical protein n=1 Tax=Bremerella sp. JC770 TaxID=3232137 RepID=UPI0034594BC5